MSGERPLTDLPVADGLRFGVWHAWRTHAYTPEGLFVVLPGSRLVVGFCFPSVGWIDFRSAKGRWHTCFSNGSFRRDQGHESEAASFADRQPASAWPEGVYVGGRWTFDARPDRLVVRHAAAAVPFVFHRGLPLWTRGKKPLPGCEG